MESQADALNQLAGDELDGKVAIFLIIKFIIFFHFITFSLSLNG